MKVKKGDNVIVITGKSKGQTGKISKVLIAQNRIIIEGVNKTKRHVKPRATGEKGTTIEKESSIHASNVKLVTK